ncbi:hypothetical protein [Cytophaga aurantiaca]|uniref:hypothetical protein n=1 Tax=Cytophaga aurantiaca TaxID=29530 RepID=UPI00036CBD5E|nr:hypothetical protein [Cytophaga aurantiaca]
MRKSITLLFIFFLTLFVSVAQFKRQREYSGFFDTYYYRGPITFTLGGGVTTYRGDLTDGIGLNGLGAGFSLGANYKLWPHIVFGAEFSYLKLHSNDFNTTRNLSFNTTGYELQIYGRLYLIDEIVRVAPDRRKESQYTFCKPYIHAGLGGLYYSPTVNYDPSIQLGGVTGSGGMTFVIPAGLGLQFTITQRSSLCVEYIYRFTMTDYLDGFSNAAKNDGYGLFQAKFQFAPTAPKKKKKLNLAPPAKYEGAKGTETWKTRKAQGDTNKPQKEEYQMPDENVEQNTDTQEGEEQNQEGENQEGENQEAPAEEATPE